MQTLQELRTRVRRLTDTEYGGFLSDAELDSYINTAISDVRDELIASGRQAQFTENRYWTKTDNTGADPGSWTLSGPVTGSSGPVMLANGINRLISVQWTDGTVLSSSTAGSFGGQAWNGTESIRYPMEPLVTNVQPQWTGFGESQWTPGMPKYLFRTLKNSERYDWIPEGQQTAQTAEYSISFWPPVNRTYGIILTVIPEPEVLTEVTDVNIYGYDQLVAVLCGIMIIRKQRGDDRELVQDRELMFRQLRDGGKRWDSAGCQTVQDVGTLGGRRHTDTVSTYRIWR